MWNPDYTDEGPPRWLGRSPVLWLGLGAFLGGIPLMFWWKSRDGAFFRTKPRPDRHAVRRPKAASRCPPLVPDGAPR